MPVELLYCRGLCGTAVIELDTKRDHRKLLAQCRIVDGYRLCTTCADEYENARELGYSFANALDMIKDKRIENALDATKENRKGRVPVKDWKTLPIARGEDGRPYPQMTFLTEAGLSPERVTSIIIGYELAVADVDRWLDTLRNPEAPQVEKDRARLLLEQSAKEYQWICEQRASIGDKLEAIKR